MYINSPGGSVTAGLAILDTMRKRFIIVMKTLLSKPDFIEYDRYEIEIPEIIVPAFYGLEGGRLPKELTAVIERFCSEELRALSGKMYTGKKMICKLCAEPGFVPAKVPADKISAEGFELRLTRDEIKIISSTGDGVRQGVNTLLELFRTQMCRRTYSFVRLATGMLNLSPM